MLPEKVSNIMETLARTCKTLKSHGNGKGWSPGKHTSFGEGWREIIMWKIKLNSLNKCIITLVKNVQKCNIFLIEIFFSPYNLVSLFSNLFQIKQFSFLDIQPVCKLATCILHCTYNPTQPNYNRWNLIVCYLHSAPSIVYNNNILGIGLAML